MSTVIEDSSAVAVDHDAHVTQLDFVDKIPDGDHAVVHVAEPTSPVPQSTPPEPALPSTPFTNNSLPEEAYQQRRARHRSTIEVRQILFSFFYFIYSTSIRRVPPIGSQASLLTLSIAETLQ